MSAAEHFLVKAAELPKPPFLRAFDVGGTKILLAHSAGRLFAVGALCPHAKAPLVEGAVCGTRLVCPWHQSVFNLRDGSMLEPPSLDGLPSYPVLERDGEIFVQLEPSGQPPAPSPATLDQKTVAIIGAGAAGEAAAEALRAAGFEGRVILIGPEKHAPYDRTNLSKHFLTGHAGLQQLPLRDDPDFLAARGIERRQGTVTRLDVAGKRLTFADGRSLVYDAAILATGGVPVPLNVPGADLPEVCLLRNVEDAQRIVRLAEGEGKSAVVIGGSFISLEVASSLAQRGVQVTVVARQATPLENVLGPEVGRSIQRLHEQNGVHFYPGQNVARIERHGDGSLAVTLDSGECLSADFVVAGLGVRPNTGFVEGLTLTDEGGISVDATLHAGHDLYAVGDLAVFPFEAADTSKLLRIEHWRVAQQHARLAAHNVARPRARKTLSSAGFVPFFWTFNFGQRLNYVGHAEPWDEVIFDGDPNQPPFLVYYLKDGVTQAAAGVWRDADLAALHELLRVGSAPVENALRAGGYSPVQALASV